MKIEIKRMIVGNALYIDGVCAEGWVCSGFAEWFNSTFGRHLDGGRQPTGRQLWNAIPRPGWMVYFLVGWGKKV